MMTTTISEWDTRWHLSLTPSLSLSPTPNRSLNPRARAYSELAASVGQDAVWGKPFPNGDQMARELIELLRNRRRVA